MCRIQGCGFFNICCESKFWIVFTSWKMYHQMFIQDAERHNTSIIRTSTCSFEVRTSMKWKYKRVNVFVTGAVSQKLKADFQCHFTEVRTLQWTVAIIIAWSHGHCQLQLHIRQLLMYRFDYFSHFLMPKRIMIF